MDKVIIGVDLGGTFVKTAIVSTEKKIIAKASRPSDADGGPTAVMDAMEASVRDLLAENVHDVRRALADRFRVTRVQCLCRR